MGDTKACQTFWPMISAYIDTELKPAERAGLERHLSACPSCTLRASDLRAESALVRVGLDILADEADFKDFSQKVLARVTPEQPPLWERLSLWLSETFTYQRGTLVTVAATAVVVLAVATPLLLSRQVPLGYAQERLEVQAVSVDESQKLEVRPVVLETDTGDAIIFLSEPEERKPTPINEEAQEEGALEPATPVLEKRPNGGEL
jgi:anti-sigma factor RsiW